MPASLDTVRPVELAELRAARQRIAGTIVRTPLVRLELGAGYPDIRLKLENLQPINAYKLRGAAGRRSARAWSWSPMRSPGRQWKSARIPGLRAASCALSMTTISLPATAPWAWRFSRMHPTGSRSSPASAAAALTGKAGQGPIVAIVSGGNIDLQKFCELLAATTYP